MVQKKETQIMVKEPYMQLESEKLPKNLKDGDKDRKDIEEYDGNISVR